MQNNPNETKKWPKRQSVLLTKTEGKQPKSDTTTKTEGKQPKGDRQNYLAQDDHRTMKNNLKGPQENWKQKQNDHKDKTKTAKKLSKM